MFKITFAPRGVLQIDDARIIWRNFEGRATRFKPVGNREFALVIPNKDIADKLVEEGWNVKIKVADEGYDDDLYTLPVKLKYDEDGNGPNAYLVSGSNVRRLDDRTISCLDRVTIASVDLDIRPYDWDYAGKSGRTAYLKSIRVHQELDRFADQLAEDEFPGEETPW